MDDPVSQIEHRTAAPLFRRLPGTLAIGGIRVLGCHGLLPEELQRTQPFEVGLELELDLAAVSATDRLTDTVDYAAVVEAAKAVVEGPPVHLLETLSVRIATAVLDAAPRASAVRAEVRKLRPPVPADLAWAGVAVHLSRGDMGRRAFLSFGSNQGDRLGQMRAALESLGGRLVAVSPVYETEPQGGPPAQPPYLNLVAELHTMDSARDLLNRAAQLEAAAGRARSERWGPRTLDVDVLWVDGETVDEPDLQVPHPRMWDRRFVTVPLADLAPRLVAEHHAEHAEGEVRLMGSVWPDARLERRAARCGGQGTCA
ncbi:MAG: 2-amino-4-hydroxy-6-hydroxymethyldihydropteridine diphosphokinase [Actinomycetota bacterium]|nr:2-amino-4-hydroxy-6-hydroxymethyldihydropteridine diphosphokinase [Actinomycetota bacterium]